MRNPDGPTTLAGLIAPELAEDGERVAVIEGQRSLSFKALDHEADQVAAALLALGLRQGDHVMCWMEACAEALVIAIGAARAGCVLVTLDPRASAAELARALGLCKARVLMLSSRPVCGDRLAALKEAVPHCFRGDPGATHCAEAPELRTVVVSGPEVPDGAFAASAALGLGRSVPRDRVVSRILKTDPASPAWVAYVSCFDSRPRGVVLSHAALGRRIGAVTARLGEPTGPVLNMLPLHDVSAAIVGAFASLWRGTPQVLADGLETGEALGWIPRAGVSEVVAAPHLARALLKHPDRPRWEIARLKVRVLCGVHEIADLSLPIGVVDESVEVLELVGASEATGPVFAIEPGPNGSSLGGGEHATALDGIELRFPAEGRPDGGVVEVVASAAMLGYQGDAAATERVLGEGWLRLPVRATVDAGGRLTIAPLAGSPPPERDFPPAPIGTAPV